jgi:hypothetical protein
MILSVVKSGNDKNILSVIMRSKRFCGDYGSVWAMFSSIIPARSGIQNKKLQKYFIRP